MSAGLAGLALIIGGSPFLELKLDSGEDAYCAWSKMPGITTRAERSPPRADELDFDVVGGDASDFTGIRGRVGGVAVAMALDIPRGLDTPMRSSRVLAGMGLSCQVSTLEPKTVEELGRKSNPVERAALARMLLFSGLSTTCGRKSQPALVEHAKRCADGDCAPLHERVRYFQSDAATCP